MKRRPAFFAVAVAQTLGLLLVASTVRAEDWPTWRHDAQRSGVTSDVLPTDLALAWSLKLPPQVPAWPEDTRLGFDAQLEPIVASGTLLVASATADSVTAYDAASGQEKWRFYAEAPIRLAPLAVGGRLYFGADDGFYYCLSLADGAVQWKLNVAPSSRHVLGNERMISVWPVRGGSAVLDNKLYFTCGVWPFEGTLLYSIDLADGAKRDEAGVPAYVNTTLPNLSPQGYIAASAGRLFIPCGRSKTAMLDLASGRFQDLNYDSKGRTDYHVTLADKWLLHGDRVVNVDTQMGLNITAVRPVATEKVVYCPDRDQLMAYGLENLVEKETKDRRGNVAKRLESAKLWQLDLKEIAACPVAGDEPAERKWRAENPLVIDLLAGDKVLGHKADVVFAAAPMQGETPAAVAWQAKAPGKVATQVLAGGRLYVVTTDGGIHCYAAGGQNAVLAAMLTPASAAHDDWTERAKRIYATAGKPTGYALVLGAGSGRLVEELAAQPNLRQIVVEPDAAAAAGLRERLRSRGLYGAQATVLTGTLESLRLPPYFANLITAEQSPLPAGDAAGPLVKQLFEMLRPYGGKLCLELDDQESGRLAAEVSSAQLNVAQLVRSDTCSVLTRVGALPGSAEWTHEYSDAANTLMSRDELVKAPLGVLWYGGPSALGELYFDRHDWGPSMAVVEGRIFFQGPGKLSAVDAYTGQVLWQRDIKLGKGLGRAGNFAVAGYHLVASTDALYLAYEDTCLVFDPKTGEERAPLALPVAGDHWGRMRIAQDVLLVEVFGKHPKFGPLPLKLTALDRHSGRELWTYSAGFALPFFAVGDGKVYCFDGILQDLYRDTRRKGNVPKAATERFVVALDLPSGKELWRQPTEMIVTWLSYSAAQDVLVASNKSGVMALNGQTGAVLWQRTQEGMGFGGHPESVWDKVIVYKDRIIDQRGPGLSYYLETGEPLASKHPLTGEQVNWEFTKSGHHCNYAIASEHLLTFRAADAGFFDMIGNGTSRLSGFRSGCRNSLLPACGVLNAPNFAHGCVCGYSLFTSLSFVHVPDVELWTYTALPKIEGRVRQVGLNLGAPGDRRDDNGTLWLDYPSIGGASPDLPVQIEPAQPRWFRHHAQQMTGDGLRWVAASGAEGVRKLTVRVAPEGTGAQKYTVRLHFAEPDHKAAGERVFDVALQGQKVKSAVDVAASAGGVLRTAALDFPGIDVAADLVVELTPVQGEPILCGVELVAEKL